MGQTKRQLKPRIHEHTHILNINKKVVFSLSLSCF